MAFLCIINLSNGHINTSAYIIFNYSIHDFKIDTKYII